MVVGSQAATSHAPPPSPTQETFRFPTPLKRLDAHRCQEAELLLDMRAQQAHRMSSEATGPLLARADSCITRRMRKLLLKVGH